MTERRSDGDFLRRDLLSSRFEALVSLILVSCVSSALFAQGPEPQAGSQPERAGMSTGTGNSFGSLERVDLLAHQSFTEYFVSIRFDLEDQLEEARSLGLPVARLGESTYWITEEVLQSLVASGVEVRFDKGVTTNRFIGHGASESNLEIQAPRPEHSAREPFAVNSSGSFLISSGTVNDPIPDGGSAWRGIQVGSGSGAPPGSTTTDLQYRLRIDNAGDPGSFYCGDYEIYLSSTASGGATPHHLVYDNLGGRTDGGFDDDTADDSDIYLNWRSTNHFNGEDPNQQWYVYINDVYTSDFGFLNYIEFYVFWENLPACYHLDLSHTGQGTDPTASPSSSTGCSNGEYHAGEVIQLTASPDPGQEVGSWSGTSDDAGTSTTNSVTMPAAGHEVFVNYVPGDLDFGDAPDPTYSTLAASDGARHLVTGTSPLLLGATIDVELDGQPSAGATGDGADEDGVAFTSALRLNVVSTSTGVGVATSAAGVLNAWVDIDADGDWDDVGEQIFTNEVLTGGINVLTFGVRPEAVLGSTYARFRLNSAGGLSYDGLALDGEVEDYAVDIIPDDDLDLFNMALTEDREFFACNSITAGGDFTIVPDLSILAPAKITFHGGNLAILKNGVFVEEGAGLTVVLGAIPGCP